MKPIFLFAGLFLLLRPAGAQCAFTPAVSGNTLLCPLSTTTLSTETYDAYQWYSRAFPNGTSQPIPGATGPTLQVSADDVPFYVSVSATLNGCTEQSAEVLVDGLAFLPVTVLSDGFFDVGPEGEMIICQNQPAFLIALPPYTTNFTWYNGPNPIPGANDDTLKLSGPGEYWLTASPGECPNFVDALGVQITVVWSDVPGCTPLSSPEPIPQLPVEISPNPARTHVDIRLPDNTNATLTLVDAAGRILRREMVNDRTRLYVGDLPRGAYMLQFTSQYGNTVRKLVLKDE
ncbi:MAG: T9SS type A sorting domain-containing protein [Saprospiraceae bacterium]|nr:T9SS type A sorting domain-containing protein [Saprospiraceae bacterium]